MSPVVTVCLLLDESHVFVWAPTAQDGVEENNLMEFNLAAYIQLITPLSDSEYNSGGATANWRAFGC
eukprot:2658497-Amphidinium_carterae.1